MLESLLLILLFVTVISVRILPNLLGGEGYAPDEAFHIYYADEIRTSGHLLPDTYEQILPKTTVKYPPLVHWVVSFLPHSFVSRISPLFGAFVDLIHMLLLMVWTFWLFTTSVDVVPPVYGTLLTGGAFAITPKLVTGRPITSRLRLSGRAVGGLLVTVAVASLVSWVLTHQLLFLGLATVTISLIALTNNFSMQTLIIIFVFYGVALGNVLPLILLGIGAALAYTFSGGRYWLIVRAHFGTIWYYLIHNEPQRVRSFLQTLRTAPMWLLNITGDNRMPSPMSFCQNVYQHHVIGGYLQVPGLFLLFLLIINGPVPHTIQILLIWIGSLLVTNMVVAIPGIPGMPAHRYLEYIVAPLSVVVAYAVFSVDLAPPAFYPLNFPLLVAICVTITVYSLLLCVINSVVDSLIGPPPELADAVDWLGENYQQCHVYAFPGHFSRRLLPDTSHITLGCLHDHFSSRAGRSECSELFTANNLEQIDDIYGIDFILGTEQAVREALGSDFHTLECVLQRGDIRIYEYQPAANATDTSNTSVTNN